MEIPKSWDNILVDQYIELRELEDSSLDYFDRMLEIISIVTDTDVDELEDLDFNEVLRIERELMWLRSEPSKNVADKLVFETTLKYIGFDNLKLSEFIDLNHYFAESFVKNLPVICAILYRQTKRNEWNETITEPYEYDPRNRKDLFMEVGITQVYGIIGSFLEYKSNFEQTYVNLFKPDLSDEDISEVDEETKREIEEEERLDKWSWERLIYSLCEGDLTKTDQVLNLPLIYVFNMLSMKQALNL